jgi:glycosyltransferase involved in cell wall biosynthesis
MMRDSGVTVPVELIHWGVDIDKFPKVDRKPGRPFTFGHMGALSMRKGTDLIGPAFQKAFPTEKDVRLICKTSKNHYPFWIKDDRIVVQQGQLSQEEMMDKFFKEIDCFVYPTRGEGFGLTIPEAMSTGVPAIATGWSGPVDFMTPEVGWTLDYSMTPAKEFEKNVYFEPCGDWAEPSFDDLVAKMRYAYDHQDEVKQKGNAAAEYIRREWRWDTKIKLFHEALEKHLK